MINVGVIGLSASGWASFRHAEALSNPAVQEHVKLVAVATSNAQSATAASEKYHVTAYGEDGPAKLIKDPNVDLVVVAVKVPLHAAIIEQAIEEGKNIFSEWPLAPTVVEAEKLALAAKAKGIRTVVGLQTRYTPSILKVEELIKANAIGRVLSSSAIITGDAWGPQTYGFANEYMEDITAGATLTSVTAAHFLDAYVNIFGEFVSVSAQMKTQYPRVKSPTPEDAERFVLRTSEDQLLLHGETTKGVMSAFHFRGSMAQTGVQGFRWEIHGETGSILLTGAMGNAGAFAPDIFFNGEKVNLPKGELSNIGKEYLQYAFNNGSLDFDYAVLRHKMVQSIYESAKTGKRTSYL
ncbi:hypothetical protein V495_00609 [Pseudogymnoascus sp. VKM F-4514 (FW-929)]|nr:hypothetical protein V495_00609 [Pseudogymnoascus sp. VKM F-4514 (FW-929)]KFY66034.1 hypothetical protein V497_01140 [Pseudogymnoascus sp. VKM F-4516 (FW-969)]